ncbi:MAG: hypothetical protein AAGH99_14170 [Planctomycetota bacterium]
MIKRYEMSMFEEKHGGNDSQIVLQPEASPVGLKGKIWCGLLAGIIVLVVSKVTSNGYDTAEAAGAAQIKIVEAEAETDDRRSGEGGSASSRDDQSWVFDN